MEIKAKGTVLQDDLPLIRASAQRQDLEFPSNVDLVGGREIQCNIRPMSVRKAVERLVVERQAQLLQRLENRVAALVSLGGVLDPYTAGHQSRGGDPAFALGAQLGRCRPAGGAVHQRPGA